LSSTVRVLAIFGAKPGALYEARSPFITARKREYEVRGGEKEEDEGTITLVKEEVAGDGVFLDDRRRGELWDEVGDSGFFRNAKLVTFALGTYRHKDVVLL